MALGAREVMDKKSATSDLPEFCKEAMHDLLPVLKEALDCDRKQAIALLTDAVNSDHGALGEYRDRLRSLNLKGASVSGYGLDAYFDGARREFDDLPHNFEVVARIDNSESDDESYSFVKYIRLPSGNFMVLSQSAGAYCDEESDASIHLTWIPASDAVVFDAMLAMHQEDKIERALSQLELSVESVLKTGTFEMLSRQAKLAINMIDSLRSGSKAEMEGPAA